ncbi:hypothetical protein F4802DRAFT_104705 [Xylaria palmicola]|nr:hypothetical protein F4802DRAFT_104705 [Xylaria palmicola]
MRDYVWESGRGGTGRPAQRLGRLFFTHQPTSSSLSSLLCIHLQYAFPTRSLGPQHAFPHGTPPQYAFPTRSLDLLTSLLQIPLFPSLSPLSPHTYTYIQPTLPPPRRADGIPDSGYSNVFLGKKGTRTWPSSSEFGKSRPASIWSGRRPGTSYILEEPHYGAFSRRRLRRGFTCPVVRCTPPTDRIRPDLGRQVRRIWVSILN